MNKKRKFISVREWLALKKIVVTKNEIRSFGRKVSEAYKYDRVEPPLKFKKVCVYDLVKDNGILEKCLTSFNKK